MGGSHIEREFRLVVFVILLQTFEISIQLLNKDPTILQRKINT